jgi:hypothetical protein
MGFGILCLRKANNHLNGMVMIAGAEMYRFFFALLLASIINKQHHIANENRPFLRRCEFSDIVER